MRRPVFAIALCSTLAGGFAPSPLVAQLVAPAYEDCRLEGIYPNGGQAGTTVTVEFRGYGHGLAGAKDIVIDGPTGITVKELKPGNGATLHATLAIAPDAKPGRRSLRVLNERTGLTNFAHFVVGRLPEHLEKEPNNESATAELVVAPAVVNGRINPQADVDVFRFQAKAGQRVVAAIAAHALDVHGQYKNYGIADFNLELLDERGQTLAASEDALGFDPLIEHVIPKDGEYIVRVALLNYGGFPEAVYRLTLGEVPYVAGAFPLGVRRGEETEVELFGPNVPPGTKQTLAAGKEERFPLKFLGYDAAPTAGNDVQLTVGDEPEIVETEPNDDRERAQPLAWPITVNGRFAQTGDADWFQVTLKAKQKIWFETIAQRFVRSPVDTLVQVFDKEGKPLAENDDDGQVPPGYEAFHDFNTTDSRLLFDVPADGEYFVRVSEQTGQSGPRAVYRLTVREAAPEFFLTHFPDAVPVWGPGSTAGVLVRIERLANGFDDDVEVSVEGLPEGWKSSSATSLRRTPERFYNYYQQKVFLTITAPADAAPGTAVPFRIVGRSKRETGVVERASHPLNLFYTSDTGFFRLSPESRVAVAKPQGPYLEAITEELTAKPGESKTLAVRVVNAGDAKAMPVVVSLATGGVACGLNVPQTIPIKEGVIQVPLNVPAEMPVGTFGISVAQSWRSDIRIGMPGPCTRLIRLTVVEKSK